MRKPKPQKLWAVTYVNSPDAMPHTIRFTRKDAIKAHCDNGPNIEPDDWSFWRKRRCLAVKVTVTRSLPPHKGDD